MTTEITVDPIVVGFPFSQTIAFVDGSGNPLAGLNLAAASRVFGQARVAPGNSNQPLATFDTASTPANLIVVNANTLSFTLSEAATWKFGGCSSVAIDFAQLIGGAWALLPVQFLQWPVLIPVTAPPT